MHKRIILINLYIFLVPLFYLKGMEEQKINILCDKGEMSSSPGSNNEQNENIMDEIIAQSSRILVERLPRCFEDPTFLAQQDFSIRNLILIINSNGRVEQGDTQSKNSWLQSWENKSLSNLCEAQKVFLEKKGEIAGRIQQVLNENGFCEIIAGQIASILLAEREKLEFLPFTVPNLLYQYNENNLGQDEAASALASMNNSTKRPCSELNQKEEMLKKKRKTKGCKKTSTIKDMETMIRDYSLNKISYDNCACPFPDCPSSTIYKNYESLTQHVTVKHSKAFKGRDIGYSALIKYLLKENV